MLSVEAAAVFLLRRVLWAGELSGSASSSPEASRDEGCRRSEVDCPLRRWDVVVRFRLPEAVEEGDDIVSGCVAELIARKIRSRRRIVELVELQFDDLVRKARGRQVQRER